MKAEFVFVKTIAGDEAVRNGTRSLQRNLRLVLVQVDGKTTVAELGSKVGNLKLVEEALRELEEGGFVARLMEETSGDARKLGGATEKTVPPAPLYASGTGSTQFKGSRANDQSLASAFSSLDQPGCAGGKMGPGSWMTAGGNGSGLGRLRLKGVLAAIFGLLAALCLGVLLFPYDRLKPDLEAALGQAVRVPVRIGHVDIGLLPRPALLLEDMDIGANRNAHVAQIRVPFSTAMLGPGPRTIPLVYILGASMPAEVLAGLASSGLPTSRQEGGIALGKVNLKQLSVAVGEMGLHNLEGEVLFDADGSLGKLVVRTDDRTLALEAWPTPQGISLNVECYGWKPAPGGPHLFESLQVKGLLQQDRLVLHHIHALSLGGSTRGNVLVRWDKGMVLTGEVALDRLNLRRVADALSPSLRMEGELSGNLRLKSTGGTWTSLRDNFEAVLDADIARGMLGGIDLMEAARRGKGESVRGGATKFERLRGLVRFDSRLASGRDIRMEAGLIMARGQFVATREGRMDADLVVSIGSALLDMRVPVRISGILPDLAAAVSR